MIERFALEMSKKDREIAVLRDALGKITIETSDDVAFDIASKALDSSTDAGKGET